MAFAVVIAISSAGRYSATMAVVVVVVADALGAVESHYARVGHDSQPLTAPRYRYRYRRRHIAAISVPPEIIAAISVIRGCSGGVLCGGESVIPRVTSAIINR